MHEPVMVREVVHHFDSKQNGIILDCTVGNGGHAYQILEKLKGRCTIIGLDQDSEALKRAGVTLGKFSEAVILRHSNFVLLDTVLDELQIDFIDGCLFDIGVSMNQLADPVRGFSFLNEGPLDMRMDLSNQITAYDIVNTYREEQLIHILKIYGEEYKARGIARAIVNERRKHRIATTTQLAGLVQKVYYSTGRRRTHPATKTFQALRIAVNNELQNLSDALQKAFDRLKYDGIMCVISFHSLEDRIVKTQFRTWAQEQMVTVVTKKPLQATHEEVARNPRARSAKMRVAKRSLQT